VEAGDGEAEAQEKAERRAQALCGPRCLAELLRRRGETVSVETLAKEMQTDEDGTSLQGLTQAARKRGYKGEGLALTQQGLARQSLPVVTLIAPGHYVLVEALSSTGVRVWDPNALAQGKEATQSYDLATWGKVWDGYAVALR